MTIDVKAPVMTPKTGKSFLESTNFRISQDMSVTDGNMKSIFKTDYPPYLDDGRTAGAQPPPLSEVMHRDERFFSEKASETVKSFEYRPLPARTEIKGERTKLSATNFKMDSDLNKFNSFTTVHNSYFTPKIGDPAKRSDDPAIRRSHIPQGDKEKAPLPASDYRDCFKGHDTSVYQLDKAPSMHEGGPPTIKGDPRQSGFFTTHNDTFVGRYEKPVQTLAPPDSHNVPTGDPDKVAMRETTMTSSFQDVSADRPAARYNVEDVSRLLNRTNFKQQDGHFKWNDYQSTATSSYRPSGSTVERFYPGKERNHSDLPEGDMDPDRVRTRVNLTTSRFYHGDPPRSQFCLMSGANKLTKSKVWFGEPPLAGTFYNTTHSNNFPPKSVPYTYNREKYYKYSDIPLSYYSKSEKKHTTAVSDYQDPKQKRIIPNPVTIDNLKKSHTFPPVDTMRHFNTTHNDTFTSKSTEPYKYDAGRLQKSSVPLGTMI